MDGQPFENEHRRSDTDIRFGVAGMTCAGCALSAGKALNGVPGISDADVDFATERARVNLGQASAAAVVDAIKAAGYSPQTVQVDLDITGMTCAGCAATVEKSLTRVPGVVAANVNLAMERASVEVLGDDPRTDALMAAVTDAGYTAQSRASDAEVRRQQAAARDEQAAAAFRAEVRSLVAAAVLTAPLLAMMVLPHLGIAYALPAWAQFALAMPVQFWIGRRFYVGAWRSLRAGAGNMDLLVALGTSAAFALSTWIMLRDGIAATGHLYFEASAVIITLILAGKLLEQRAKRGTTQAIRALMDLRPERARVERDGSIREIAVEDVAEGDLVVVRPGERIPVDGVVVSGASEVDEALITGESAPVLKEKDDKVTGGAINGNGEMRIRATRVGEDSTLAKIVRLVENAQSGKAPVQRLVDRISAIFVPMVVAAAAVALIGWLITGAGFETAVINAVSVLVIACPCALGLATPTAIVAGTGAAARAGILIKDVGVLEFAHRLDTVAFDKTGTLTQGTPAVGKIHAFSSDEIALLRFAAAVQASSEHPLARAFTSAAKAKGIEVPAASNVSAHVGSGIEGIVERQQVLIGNRRMMSSNGVDVAAAENDIAGLEVSGETPVLIAIGGDLKGVIGIVDEMRTESPDAVRRLKNLGLRTLILSGDVVRVAEAVADAAGIEDVRASLQPDQKVSAINGLRDEGRVVAMVGDGINDAPALAAADVGIAMGSGSDAAMETAGITLMRSDPRLVAAAVDVARATWRRIRWNLFWAFAFNAAGIPLAALGYLSPAVAGLAMALSSVFVVTNSLLLRGWRPRFQEASQ